jgi:hypothetical protein
MLQRDLGYVKKRTIPAVIRYPRFNKEIDSERHYTNILTIYWPHRQLLKPDCYLTREDMFNNTNVKATTLANMAKYEKLSEDLEAAWQQIQHSPNLQDSWATIAPQTEEERLDTQLDLEALQSLQEFEEIETDLPELPTPPPQWPHPSTASHVTITQSIGHLLSSLNFQQQQLYYFCELHARSFMQNQRPDPYHIFLSGGASTGKSHLIHCIFHQLSKIYSPLTDSADQITILKICPTGTAAYNIGGQTIHTALKISARDTKPLSENEMNTLRTKYAHLQLIIIDEISMVPKNMLTLIHSRLQRIKNCSSPHSWFGNCNVLAVEDFHQIPPVFGTPLYSVHSLTNIFMNLFSKYQRHEIMRQQDDIPFADFLNRMRIHTKDQPFLPANTDLFNSRCTQPTNPAIHPSIPSCLRLKTRCQIPQCQMLSSLPGDTITLTASDFRTFKGRTYHSTTPVPTESLPHEPALPSTLQVKEGAHIMLSINLDTTDGLVNGTWVPSKRSHKRKQICSPHTSQLHSMTPRLAKMPNNQHNTQAVLIFLLTSNSSNSTHPSSQGTNSHFALHGQSLYIKSKDKLSKTSSSQ